MYLNWVLVASKLLRGACQGKQTMSKLACSRWVLFLNPTYKGDMLLMLSSEQDARTTYKDVRHY